MYVFVASHNRLIYLACIGIEMCCKWPAGGGFLPACQPACPRACLLSRRLSVPKTVYTKRGVLWYIQASKKSGSCACGYIDCSAFFLSFSLRPRPPSLVQTQPWHGALSSRARDFKYWNSKSAACSSLSSRPSLNSFSDPPYSFSGGPMHTRCAPT